MISYRELAMRVLGKPLHVSDNSARPASHRVTALALTAAMVAGMSAPAFAGTYWTGNGDITVTKDTDGRVYVQQGSDDKKEDTDGNVTITSDENIYKAAQNSKSGTGQQSSSDTSAATQEAKEDAQPVVTDEDTSGQESVDSDQTPEEKDTDPSGSSSDHSETPEDAEDKPDAPEEETESDGEEEAEEEPETEGKTEGQTGTEGGETQPEGDAPAEGTEQPAGDAEGQPAFDTQELKGASTPVSEEKEDTYDKAPTTFAEKMSANFEAAVKSTTNAIINIINKCTSKNGTLNVTLDNVTVDATNKSGQSVTALTVSDAGDTTLTLKGNNYLTGKGGSSGLHKDSHKNTLTITGDGNLTTTGGAGIDGSSTGGYGIYTNGDLVLAGNGTITAIGGSGADGAYGGSGGYGIYSNGSLTISGGTITATGGDGHGISDFGIDNGNGKGGGAGISANSITISGANTRIKATGGNGSSISGATNNSTGGTGGYGISSSKATIIKDGANIELAQGGNGGFNTNGKGGRGGYGIYGGISGGLTFSGSTIQKAQGGSGGEGSADGGVGGDGISGSLTISSGTIKDTQGGNGGGSFGNGDGGNGGNGISQTTMSGGSIENAQGGNGGDSSNGNGGNGGHGSGSSTTMSGGSITAQGGNGGNGGSGNNGGNGGNGIGQTYSSATISGGTLKATGGKGSGNGSDGKGIGSTTVEITNEDADVDVTVRGGVAASAKTIELTCRHAGTVTIYNGLSGTSAYDEIHTAPDHTWDNGSTTIPATGSTDGVKTYTCSECGATRTEAIPATGEVPTENEPQPVPDENSDSENGSSTIYTGLRVLNENNVNIIQDTRQVTLTQISTTLYVDVRQDTASLDGVLADLSALMTDNVNTLVFSTNGCTSTLHLPELAALGAGGAQFVLTHSGSSATLTVGGVQHNELIH